jgi:hypothetical protein
LESVESVETLQPMVPV